MELILWRHAEAEIGREDALRKLTAKGRQQAAIVARWLRPRLEGDWRILSSPAVRTCATADALERPYETCPALGVDSSVEAILQAANWSAASENVLVVGHQPVLGQVAARLLNGAGSIPIRTASIWWFSNGSDDGIVLRAMLAPDVADDRFSAQ